MEQIFEADELRGVLHTPEHATGDALALTHGAGSNANAPLLVSLSRAFCEAGLLVLRYDLPFRVARASGPPFPAATARDREVIAPAGPDLDDGRVLLFYPLTPPKKPDQRRTGFLPAWWTPGLFVPGSRDPFGTLEELGGAMKLIPGGVDLLAVEGTGHDLKPAAR